MLLCGFVILLLNSVSTKPRWQKHHVIGAAAAASVLQMLSSTVLSVVHPRFGSTQSPPHNHCFTCEQKKIDLKRKNTLNVSRYAACKESWIDPNRSVSGVKLPPLLGHIKLRIQTITIVVSLV